MPNDEQEKQTTPAKSQTIPETLRVNVRDIDPEIAKVLANRVVAELAHVSSDIDLTNLDGVTIACNYEEALRQLDRGYVTQHVLTPSKDWAFGVAMTPGVLRDGQYKSHIVINAVLVTPLVDDILEIEQSFSLDESIHTLTHEAAHVEVADVFDQAFPNQLLRRRHTDWFNAMQWNVILGCWEEYAVCRIVGGYRSDPIPRYSETFLDVLKRAEDAANQAVYDYRTASNLDETIGLVCHQYSTLMKSYAYLLGAIDGVHQDLVNYPLVQQAVETSYFCESAQTIGKTLRRLYELYGKWPDQSMFWEIAAEFEAFLDRQGMTIERLDDQQIYVHFPLTPKTTPPLW